MKFIKKALYKILGLRRYLKLVSKVYIAYTGNGFGKDQYPEIHYLKSIIKPGFTCVDIGANLGYYSYFMAQLSGQEGKVFAVEPIPLFADIWKENLKKFKSANLVLFPYALGNDEKLVEMGMPEVKGAVHHGMTRVVEDNEKGFERKFSVEMKKPDSLFSSIEKIDFVKVDVEGYESNVFANMTDTIQKHKPIIQSELSGEENRKKCIKILKDLGYTPNILKNDELVIAGDDEVRAFSGDFYFLTKNN